MSYNNFYNNNKIYTIEKIIENIDICSISYKRNLSRYFFGLNFFEYLIILNENENKYSGDAYILSTNKLDIYCITYTMKLKMSDAYVYYYGNLKDIYEDIKKQLLLQESIDKEAFLDSIINDTIYKDTIKIK